MAWREKIIPPMLQQIGESAKRGELVVVIGAGVSTALSDMKLPSWVGLIKDGIEYCEMKGKITGIQKTNYLSHLESNDIDELLGVAEFMARKLDAPKGDLYARWLQQKLSIVEPSNQEMIDAIITLRNAQIPICTLNYDSLLEQVTGFPTINMSSTPHVTEWMRRSRQGILHLHGTWDTPTSCILSIRDYETTLEDEVRDLIQRSLGTFRRLIFIGCGTTFNDPNFSALIKWLRLNISAAQLQHFALVRENEVAERNADPTWHGFIEPISYGLNYTDLPKFIKDVFSLKLQKKPKILLSTKNKEENNNNKKIIENYKKFLIKDCGQMVIEGVKADMDTSKQKFDIEKLFVPLSVQACPPDFSQNDPDREKKLQEWQKQNKGPITFGGAFSKHKRLALLALPGGGKTMLLKRLAVAYADADRRQIGGDELPTVDVLPVLIRCREWREHIHRPISTLLDRLPDITGQINLSGLFNAIIPLLKSGRVLFLVDGLDEIHNDADRSTFVEHLESFLEEYPRISLVVTSREAGFNLVAPCLMRFCERFRVAPLDDKAISVLCDYWHFLMVGESTEARSEAESLANYLTSSPALRRLAENPLLLTMLLVVKHGAGRLPPDRVSLYGRAVEILLDTWNIKGHAALNLKEAIPQLACAAFELMRKGQQTATEKELLILLEEAREKLPQIRRYAKDSPYEFLKRVELRSSLLLEAGHQLENGITVPFYQFRHLTFQEYLAAVAVSEGHYMDYKTNNNVLTPLSDFLINEKWKEVIPMAAVLAGKQAEPLISNLVNECELLKEKVENGVPFDGEANWFQQLPSPVARLTQCLIEEAEGSQETISRALPLVAFFAHGCRSGDDWTALARGPYGAEILYQAWQLYKTMNYPSETWARNTCASLGARKKPTEYWFSQEGKAELLKVLDCDNLDNLGLGLLTWVGIIFDFDDDENMAFNVPMDKVENLLFCEEHHIWHAAAWLFALARYHNPSLSYPTIKILDRLFDLWKTELKYGGDRIADFSLSQCMGMLRDNWRPAISEQEKTSILNIIESSDFGLHDGESGEKLSSLFIAFHARNIISDKKLIKCLKEALEHENDDNAKKIQLIIDQLK